MIVCAFAVVCCMVAFYIIRVRILRVCFRFRAFGLFARVCLFCVRSCRRLLLCVASLHTILHVCVDCMCVLFPCLWLVCVCWHAGFACDCVCICRHMLQCSVSRYTCEYIACLDLYRACLWIVCTCLLVLRVIVYAFAFVCCKAAFLILNACGLHVWFAFVLLFRLFVLVCLYCV